MTDLFNLSTLKVTLHPSSRSLLVELSRPKEWNAINFTLIEELELLFTWCSSHTEINSILLTSSLEIFSKGFDYHEFLQTPDHKIQKYLIQFQKIIYSMFFLPQTIVIDLRKGCVGAAAELAIGADIRFAHHDCSLHFNHLDMGLIPSCGGIGFLSTVIPKSVAKNWILSSSPIQLQELTHCGFVYKAYENDAMVIEQLEKIATQAPIARIQAKRSMLESVLPELNQAIEYEKNFAFGAMYAQDWKISLEAKLNGVRPQFKSIKDFKEILKVHGKLNLPVAN